MFHGPMGGGPGGPGGPGARLRGAMDSNDDDALGKVYDAKLMRRLPHFMNWAKGNLALGTLGTFIRIGATLTLPILVAKATNDYIQQGNFNGLTVICLIYLLVSGVMWFGQYLGMLHLSIGGQIIYKLRIQLFDHLHTLSLGFFDRNKAGKLMSRVQNDVDQLQTLMTQDIIGLAANVIMLAAIAIIMLSMDLKLALICLSVVPVLIIIMLIWQRLARRAFLRVRQAISVVNDQLQEGISGIRVTQSLSREDINLQQFDKVNKAHLDANKEAARLQAFMMPVVEILTNTAFALVLVFGGFELMDGHTTVGTLLAFMLFIQRFFGPVMEIIMLYTEIQRATASGIRILELTDVKAEIQDKTNALVMPSIKGQIEFDHIEFSYEENKEILHNINLTINPGETVAIAGTTGAGKSSLTGLIARFYEVSGGAVRIDGLDVRDVTQNSLRRQIGIVPQDPFLFSGTIEDNIRYGRLEASHSDIEIAAKTAGVHDLITRLEKGYQTSVGERGASLSAGQRQLVCLARAILANPPIFILDEATSSVDTNTERIMQASLKKISKGRTCVIIAHRLSTITDADRIVVIQKGNIVEMGSHPELMAKQGQYFHMYQTLNAQAR
jgi:ABC-type multidrug transport system fused ATPase/permease subunit